MSALLHYGHKLLNRAYRLKAISFMVLSLTCLLGTSMQAQTDINSRTITQEVPLSATSTTDFVFSTANFNVQNDIESADMFEVIVTGREGGGSLEVALNGGDAQQFDIEDDDCGGGGMAGPQTFLFGDMNCYSTIANMITININRGGQDCGDNMVGVQLRWVNAFTADAPEFDVIPDNTITVDAGANCNISSADALTQISNQLVMDDLISDNVATPMELGSSLSIVDAPAEYASTCGTAPAHDITLVITDGCDLSANDTIMVSLEVTEDDDPTAEINGVGSVNTDRLVISWDGSCQLTDQVVLDSILSGTDLMFGDADGCGVPSDSIVIESVTAQGNNSAYDQGTGIFSRSENPNDPCFANFRVSVQGTDLCGNSTTQNVFIRIEDQTPPEITAPGAVTIVACSVANAAAFAGAPEVVAANISAADNCDDMVVLSYSDVNDSDNQNFSPIIACEDPVRVYIFADDGCGNIAVDSIEVTVVDVEKPTFEIAGGSLNFNLGADCDIDSMAIVTRIRNNDDIALADNCLTNVDIDIVVTGDFVNGALLPTCASDGTRTATVSISAIDACGNDSTITNVVINMIDNIGPSIDFTDNTASNNGNASNNRIFLTVDASCTLGDDELIDSLENYLTVSGCNTDDATLSIANSAAPYSPNCGANADGFITVMVNGVNECSEETTAPIDVYLRIIDDEAPVINVPTSIVFNTSSASALSSDCEITEQDFLDSLVLNSAYSLSDNCTDSADIVITTDIPTNMNAPFQASCSEDMISYTVMITATDACASNPNSTTVAVTVSVIDDSAPVIDLSTTEITLDVPDLTCGVDSATIADAIIGDGMLNGYSYANAGIINSVTDKCNAITMGVEESGGLSILSCNNPTQDVTFFAEDACGNRSTETVTITLNEVDPTPAVTFGGETARGGTQGDQDAGIAPIAGSDNTVGNGTNPEVIVDVALNASCGITLSEISMTVLAEMNILADGCTDVAILLSNSEVNILENIDLPVQNDVSLGDAICGDQFNIEFSTADECGNVTTMHFTVELVDNEDPIISGPTTFLLYASATDCGPLSEETLIDNLVSAGLTTTVAPCGDLTFELFMDNPETGEIEYGTDVDARYGDLPGSGIPPIEMLTASCSPQNVTMFVRVQEACGSSTSGFSDVVEITVSYLDTLAPEFEVRTEASNPSQNVLINDTLTRQVTTGCDTTLNVNVFITSGFVDCNENPLTVSYSIGETGINVGNLINATFPVGVTDVTTTITDGCMNSTTYDFTVVIEDVAAPTVEVDFLPTLPVIIGETCSIDSLSLLDSILAAINNDILNIDFMDNCVIEDTIIVNGMTSYEIGLGCVSFNTVEIVVVDTSGNQSPSVSVPIVLIDNIAPTVTASAGSTPATAIQFDACGINLDDFNIPAAITDALTASDNCSDGVFSFSDILGGLPPEAFNDGNLKNFDGSPFEIDFTSGDQGLCDVLTIAVGRDRRNPIVWKDLTCNDCPGFNWPEGSILATVEFSDDSVEEERIVKNSGKRVGKIEGRQVFDMEDGQNDELEELLFTLCMANRKGVEIAQFVGDNNKAFDYDIEACDVEGPQPVYFSVVDNCGNATIDSIYVDVFENSKPNLFVNENYVHSFTIPGSTMSCSPNPDDLVNSIRFASLGNVTFSAACPNESASLSIDAASLAGLEVNCSAEQQITIRVTGQCNEQDTFATLRIRLLEEAPAPIVVINGDVSASGVYTNGVKGDQVNGIAPEASTNSNFVGGYPKPVEIPLDATTCMIDGSTILSIVTSGMDYSLRDNCTDSLILAGTVDVRVLNNIDLPDDNDIDLSTLVCGDIFDLEYTVTDECGNVTAIHFPAIVVNNETPEVILPGGAQTFDFTLYSSGNNDCTALNTDELEERLIEAGLDSSGICGDAIFEFFLDNPETGAIEYGDAATGLMSRYEDLGLNGTMSGITGADPQFELLTPECEGNATNVITLYVRVSEECVGSEDIFSDIVEITVTMLDTTAADFTLYGGNVVNDTLTVTTSDYDPVDPDGCDFDVDKRIINVITDCNSTESIVTYTDLTDATNVLETGETNDYLIGTFPVGFSDVEVSVADACGNVALDTIVVEVIDGVNPTITITEEGSSSTMRLGVQIGADCSIDSLSLLDSILTLTNIVFADSCGIDETIISSMASYALSDGTTMCSPDIRVYIQTTDMNDNTTTEEVFITLEDSIAPVLEVPGELTFLTSEFGPDLTLGEFRDSLLRSDLFDVSDNCTDSTTIVNNTMDLTVVVDGVDVGFGAIESTCDSIFKIAVDVRDYCGDNLTTDTVLVTLQDDVQPLLDLHGDIESFVNDTLPLLYNGVGLCTVDVGVEADQAPRRINVLEGALITDDNETTVTATATFEDGVTVVDSFEILFSNMSAISAAWPVGVTRVDYSVTDACGNDSTLVFFVEVADNEDPQFMEVPMNMTFDNEAGQCDSTVTFNCPLVMDNCGVDSLQVWYVFDDGSAGGDTIFVEVFTGEDATGGEEAIFPFEVGVTDVRFRAVDIHGNDYETSFSVTIEDNEDPVFECPQSINLYLDVDGMAVLDASALMANGATDNCGLVTMGISEVLGGTPGNIFSCTNIGDAIVYRVTAEDESGNIAPECQVQVIVMDTISPTITLVDDLVILTCGESYIEDVMILDNCDGSPSLSIDGSVNTNVAGTYVLNYNGTDASGNAATQVSRTVIVESGLPVGPIVISGDAGITPGTVVTYTFPSFVDIDEATINWSYTGAGAIFISGQGSNTVTINFTTGFTPGDLIVNVSNVCAQVSGTLAITEQEECLDELTVVAIDNIIDEYFANERVISSALVESARDILFQAAESIELTPDFEVELGAVFEANIGPCLTPTTLTQMLDENNGVER